MGVMPCGAILCEWREGGGGESADRTQRPSAQPACSAERDAMSLSIRAGPPHPPKHTHTQARAGTRRSRRGKSKERRGRFCEARGGCWRGAPPGLPTTRRLPRSCSRTPRRASVTASRVESAAVPWPVADLHPVFSASPTIKPGRIHLCDVFFAHASRTCTRTPSPTCSSNRGAAAGLFLYAQRCLASRAVLSCAGSAR